MKLSGTFHLTYCTNVFPGETWEEIEQTLSAFLPVIREKVWPESPFGVGLRLSAQAAETLQEPGQLTRFRLFLKSQNSYVFTINGFPYGEFHKGRIKENVYLPDWRDRRRLEYTNRLAQILSALLPDDGDIEGSISTVPGAYKASIHAETDVQQIAKLMLEHVVFLYRLRENTGKTISLALEPEPCCQLETIDETVAFFHEYLFGPWGLETLCNILQVGRAEADQIVHRHVGVCFDACHMATEFEDVSGAIRKLKSAGIRISKVQISSALKLRFRSGDGCALQSLGRFAEGTYLHQVVEQSRFGLRRFTDLPEALADEASGRDAGLDKEWRVHFHVPIFLRDMGAFENTQPELVSLIQYLRDDPVCLHLEAETYTWDVLPIEYRAPDLVSAVARELNWVRDKMME